MATPSFASLLPVEFTSIIFSIFSDTFSIDSLILVVLSLITSVFSSVCVFGCILLATIFPSFLSYFTSFPYNHEISWPASLKSLYPICSANSCFIANCSFCSSKRFCLAILFLVLLDWAFFSSSDSLLSL